jgi:hypothetical protein
MQPDKLQKWAYLLVLIGAINWFFVGLFGFNIIGGILGFIPFLPRLIFIVVGVAGGYLAYLGWKAKTLW